MSGGATGGPGKYLEKLLEPADSALFEHLKTHSFDVSQIKVVLPWHGRGRSRTASRQIVFVNGDRVAVLNLLAWIKEPTFDPSKHKVFWRSVNPLVETIDNVLIIDKASKRAPSKYGVAAGTPEYFKRYREFNRERIKQRSRARYAREKALSSAVLERAKTVKPEQVEASSSLLEDILKGK